VAFFVDGALVGWVVDGDGDGVAEGDGESSSRRPLRDARSSLVRLADTVGVPIAFSAVGTAVSVVGPRVIAATAAPRTTPARVSAATRGT
jgi:hypothetical protein